MFHENNYNNVTCGSNYLYDQFPTLIIDFSLEFKKKTWLNLYITTLPEYPMSTQIVRRHSAAHRALMNVVDP